MMQFLNIFSRQTKEKSYLDVNRSEHNMVISTSFEPPAASSPKPPMTLDVHALAQKSPNDANTSSKFSFRKNSMLRREMGFSLYIILCTTFVGVEMSKQVTTYAIRYKNEGRYPIAQTALVAVVELIKLLIVTTIYVIQYKVRNVNPNEHFRISFKFIVPSILYAINNNLYYLALTMVAPPIWMIIIQSRVVMTALIYKFIFKREITGVQWIGTFFITIAVITNELPNLFGDSHLVIPAMAILLSFLSAAISCGAAVYAEMLLKNSTSSFLGQQIQLYFFGFIVSYIGHIASTKEIQLIKCDDCKSSNLLLLVIFCLLLNSAGGMVVATIIKYLDNIVKIYTSAVANILTAVLCTIFFPENFEFNVVFLISLTALFLGIYLYEARRLPYQFKNINVFRIFKK